MALHFNSIMKRINIDKLPHIWNIFFGKRIKALDAQRGTTLTELLFAIRDLPYRRPIQDNTWMSCLNEECGTCSSKHKAVYELLKILGYQPKLWQAAYLVDFNKAYFSDKLKEMSQGKKVFDVHNYVSCHLDRNKETIIDITFPVWMWEYGFPVTREWDEEKDFLLCCSPEVSFELDAPEKVDSEKKQLLLTQNSLEALYLRELAILEMSKVLNKTLQA